MLSHQGLPYALYLFYPLSCSSWSLSDCSDRRHSRCQSVSELNRSLDHARFYSKQAVTSQLTARQRIGGSPRTTFLRVSVHPLPDTASSLLSSQTVSPLLLFYSYSQKSGSFLHLLLFDVNGVQSLARPATCPFSQRLT